MNKFNFNKLTPFKWFILENFPFVEADFDALTNWQLFCKLGKEMNKIIKSENDLGTQMENVTNAFIELQNYVNTYFNNLDVQDEINNKLDEMTEDGTLTDIIENKIFNTLNVNNNFTILNRKIVDSTRNLIYYKTILRPNIEKISYIPLKGELSGNNIEETENNPINMFDFSTKINSIFISNADSVGSFLNHAIVRNGSVLKEGGTTSGNVLAITNDGNILILDGNVTGTELIEDYDVVNSWGCSSIIRNGIKDIDTSTTVGNTRHPRTVVCQEYNSKDIIFLHIEGRKPTSVGVTFEECADLILETMPNIKCACCVGGGGDSQLMIKGRMINDSNDNQLRPLYDVFYLDPNINSFDNSVSSEIGNARMSELTMREFLKSRVNLTETYLKAKRLLIAELISINEYGNKFICNQDYNTTLEINDTIIVSFPDLTNNENAYKAGDVCLNIHFTLENNQPTVLNKYGNNVKLAEINNRTVLLKWDGTHYILIDILPTIIQAPENFDLDNLKDFSMMYSYNFINKPQYLGADVGAGIVIALPVPIFNYTIQLYLVRPSNNIYIRCNDNGTWNNWTRLSDNIKQDFENKDANDLINYFYRGYGNNMTNRPSGASNGWIINMAGVSNGYNAQIFLERQTNNSTGRVYIRFQENGTWNDWKQISFVS